jgi:hypothetical protein
MNGCENMSEDIKALKQIYSFSKVRGFKLGLNAKYVKVSNNEQVIEQLLNRKLVYIREKYGQNYLIPTEEGINLVEGKKAEPDSRFEYMKVKNPKTGLITIIKRDLGKTGFESMRIVANVQTESEANQLIESKREK